MDRSVADFNVRLRTITLIDLIIGIIITLILTGVSTVVFPEIMESDDLLFIVVFLIGILLFALVLKGSNGLDRDIKNIFETENTIEILYVFALNILFALLFMFALSSIDIIINFNDPNWIPLWNIDSVDVDSGALILESIGAIIFAPIAEELIFRGVLYNRIKIRTGVIPAMIISSILFASGHEVGGMISAFLFGICMCILYQKTDNILIPMSVHLINNLFSTALDIFHLDILLAQFPIIILSLLISVIGTVYLFKYIILQSLALRAKYS